MRQLAEISGLFLRIKCDNGDTNPNRVFFCWGRARPPRPRLEPAGILLLLLKQQSRLRGRVCQMALFSIGWYCVALLPQLMGVTLLKFVGYLWLCSAGIDSLLLFRMARQMSFWKNLNILPAHHNNNNNRVSNITIKTWMLSDTNRETVHASLSSLAHRA